MSSSSLETTAPVPASRPGPAFWASIAALTLVYVVFRLILARHYLMYDPDEALEMLVAQTLHRGQIPFVDCYSHRGPFHAVLYAIPLLFGEYNLTAVYIFTVGFFLAATISVAYAMARALRPSTGVAMMAVLLLIAMFWIPDDDTYALDSDVLMTSLAMFGFAVLIAAQAPTAGAQATSRPRHYFLAGLLLALSFLTKQNGAFFAWVPAAFILSADRDRWLQKSVAYGLGFGLPIALCFAFYLGIGEWTRFWHLFYVYNSSYATKTGAQTLGDRWALVRFVEMSENLLLVPAYAMAVWLFLTGDRSAFRRSAWLIFLWALGGTLVAIAPSRPWGNYLWAAHPPIAAGAGVGLVVMAHTVLEGKGWRPRLERLLALLLITIALAFHMGTRFQYQVRTSRLPWYFKPKIEPLYVGGIHLPAAISRTELVRLIQEKSGPEDYLYVNGYAPELYILAERRYASRQVISNFVENYYPASNVPTEINEKYLTELRNDLERTRPKIIVDAVSLGFMGPRDSKLRGPLYDYLEGRYTPVVHNSVIAFYVRLPGL